MLFGFANGPDAMGMEQIALVHIGNETYRSVHDRPCAILTTNATTGQLIQQHWSKNEQGHYRKQKPSSHRVSSLSKAGAEKNPAKSRGATCALTDQRHRVKSGRVGAASIFS
jgi:hypothetical protein